MKVNIREVGRVWGGAALDGGRERKKGENRPRRRRKSLKYVSRGGEESRKDGDVEQGQHNKKKAQHCQRESGWESRWTD